MGEVSVFTNEARHALFRYFERAPSMPCEGPLIYLLSEEEVQQVNEEMKRAIEQDETRKEHCTAEMEQESIVPCTPTTVPEHQFLFVLDTIKVTVRKEISDRPKSCALGQRC